MPVAQLMIPIENVACISTTHSLMEALIAAHVDSHTRFPVCEDGQILGVVTVRDVHAIPTALWPWRRIRDIMLPASPAFCIPPDWPVMQALDHMAQGGLEFLLVMENGQIVGLITRSAIAQYLQLHKA